MSKKAISLLLSLTLLVVTTPLAFAAADCQNRGDLDFMYCDDDNDLTADPPQDASLLKDPNPLVFTYTPVEDPGMHKEVFADFLKFLSQKTGKKVVYFTVHSNSAEVEAMRSGRLHVAGFATGPTNFAVNLSGFVPIAIFGHENEMQGYRLLVVVKKDSPIKNLHDLKGTTVAHTSPSSNSGHLAPMALFPRDGITPGVDYSMVFSGKHDLSILGVSSGEYDAACIASDVYNRMVDTKRINKEDYRIVWQSSSVFPTSSFGYAYNLSPELVAKIKEAFAEYTFPPKMQQTFGNADRFYPITYKKEFELVRIISKLAGETFDEKGLALMKESEEKFAESQKNHEGASNSTTP